MSETKREQKEERRAERRSERRLVNNVWLWIGVIILIAVLLYWLFAIGTFEDIFWGPNQ